jgi:hypothetical protein
MKIKEIITPIIWISLLALLCALLASCCNNQGKIYVHMSNGSGWNLSSSYIQVDSVTETTPKSATIWIDGRKTTVYAERIMIAN